LFFGIKMVGGGGGGIPRLAVELLAAQGQCYIELVNLYLKNDSGSVGRWEHLVQILGFRWPSFMFIVPRGGGN